MRRPSERHERILSGFPAAQGAASAGGGRRQDGAHPDTATAVVKRGSVTIAISTGGASPMLSGRLRRALEEALPGNLGEWTSLLADLRIQLKRALPDDLQGQRELIAQFIESVTQ